MQYIFFEIRFLWCFKKIFFSSIYTILNFSKFYFFSILRTSVNAYFFLCTFSEFSHQIRVLHPNRKGNLLILFQIKLFRHKDSCSNWFRVITIVGFMFWSDPFRSDRFRNDLFAEVTFSRFIELKTFSLLLTRNYH